MAKKLTLIVALMLVVVMAFGVFAACNDPTPGPTPTLGTDLTGTYDITVWMSEVDGIKELTEAQIDAFEAANPGIVINATVEKVGEGDAASNMIKDVETGADIFGFAQDQLSRLVTAGALSRVLGDNATFVTDNNSAGAVNAAKVGGEIYSYPMTADNGYFMYYNKSIVPEDKLDSLEELIAFCEENNYGFSVDMENGFYVPAFFFATGCISNWTTDAKGNFTSKDDTFNSDAGLIALKGMQKLVSSKAYVKSSSCADFSAAVPSAVVISGVWETANAKASLGENLGATDLPSFTVDGETYHMSGFGGNKLLGVKPQTDAKKAAVCHKLAQWLTNEDSQVERYNTVGWGPSNVVAQELDAIKNDPILSAFMAQSAYAYLQGQMPSDWWSAAALIATSAKKKDADLSAILQTYEATIATYVKTLTDEQLRAFTVIGSIDGTNWDTDYKMIEDAEAHTWTSEKAFALKAGEAFKARQGLGWAFSIGADTASGNFEVTADVLSEGHVDGTTLYYIVLTVTVDADGTVTGGTLSLKAA